LLPLKKGYAFIIEEQAGVLKMQYIGTSPDDMRGQLTPNFFGVYHISKLRIIFYIMPKKP